MSKSSTAITRTEPSLLQMPYLSQALSQARKLYGTPLTYFPGSTIAGFTSEQQLAHNLGIQRALAGSPLISGGQAELGSIIGGRYLTPGSNPYLSAYTERAFEETLPQLDTSAIQAGRYGGGAWGLAKGRTMADITSNIYGQAYESERGRQLQALQLAPTYAEQDWANIGRLAAIGGEKQAMEQAAINEAIERFQFGQLEPWERLANYMNLISGNLGGQTYAYTRGK